jgi:hypothetical protein
LLNSVPMMAASNPGSVLRMICPVIVMVGKF